MASFNEPYSAPAPSPYDCVDVNRSIAKASGLRSSAGIAAAPERQGITTTVEEISSLADETLRLTHRLSECLDNTYRTDGATGQKDCNRPPSHIVTSLDDIAHRLRMANSRLDDVFNFVGR